MNTVSERLAAWAEAEEARFLGRLEDEEPCNAWIAEYWRIVGDAAGRPHYRHVDGRTVDANGDRSTIAAQARGDALEVVGPHGTVAAPLGVFSTNHWHAGVLDAETVLNTLTGRINQVRIEACATPHPDGEGPPQARCFDYHGDLRARVWYDDAGRWVGLAFDGEDGSRFEYRCRNCASAHEAF